MKKMIFVFSRKYFYAVYAPIFSGENLRSSGWHVKKRLFHLEHPGIPLKRAFSLRTYFPVEFRAERIVFSGLLNPMSGFNFAP